MTCRNSRIWAPPGKPWQQQWQHCRSNIKSKLCRITIIIINSIPSQRQKQRQRQRANMFKFKLIETWCGPCLQYPTTFFGIFWDFFGIFGIFLTDFLGIFLGYLGIFWGFVLGIFEGCLRDFFEKFQDFFGFFGDLFTGFLGYFFMNFKGYFPYYWDIIFQQLVMKIKWFWGNCSRCWTTWKIKWNEISIDFCQIELILEKSRLAPIKLVIPNWHKCQEFNDHEPFISNWLSLHPLPRTANDLESLPAPIFSFYLSLFQECEKQRPIISFSSGEWQIRLDKAIAEGPNPIP